MRAPPPPQDAAQRWGAFGIVVLVASGATCAATTFKDHYAPPPLPPAAPPDVLPPRAPPPVLVDQAPAAAAVPEPPPEKRGTPQASLAARPAWGKQVIDVTSSQYAPQHSRLAELFRGAEPVAADLERGFVVCQVTTALPGHDFALEDLRVRATFGTTPAVGNEGANNVALVSAPLVNLRKGESVAFEVAKVDGDEDEKRVTVRNRTVRFAGKSLSFDETRASVECRQLSGDSLEKVTMSELAVADARVQRLARQHLAGHAPGWGWPADVEVAKQASSDAAALVGWDDYRVKKRVEKVNTEIARLEGERTPLFADLHARAGFGGQLANANVMFVRLDCWKKCVIELDLQNIAGSPWQWESHDEGTHGGGLSGYVATAKSGPVALVAEKPEDPSLVAKVGKRTIVRLVPADSKLDLTKDPAIVGVCSEGRCVPLRAR